MLLISVCFEDREWAVSNCKNVSEAFVKLLDSKGVDAAFVSFLDEGEGWSHVAVVTGVGADRKVVDWTFNQFSSSNWGACPPGETHPLVMPYDEYVAMFMEEVADNISFAGDVNVQVSGVEDILACFS